MCTYLTKKIKLDGAAKGASGWFTVSDGAVYVDHPFHACHEHTLNIDFTNPGEGPSARVAVELTEEAALALIEAIQTALAAAPPGLASASGPRAAS
ncbi:hypothetical protein Pth03_57710 [Planotetraspora thailandica]|uniref:Uncharacterized protein n=1 Tax=Planotetraspora thailandica TaxID=487172 RepID=A0A8J3XWA0_9ACTN|nr:DUF6295 family protein [Planotetraspora thailandica]GII57382.1 hypothetical protein Pth03_57710 [Planotetraspora thailandica]